MDYKFKNKPRAFTVGKYNQIEIKDMGSISLRPDEQITLVTESDNETDIVRKNWGFYSSGSLNKRLTEHGFNPALVVNEYGLYYVMFVEKGRETLFNKYLKQERNFLVCWLKNENLEKIKNLFNPDLQF